MPINQALKKFVDDHDKREEFTKLFKMFDIDTYEIFVKSEKNLDAYHKKYIKQKSNESNETAK